MTDDAPIEANLSTELPFKLRWVTTVAGLAKPGSHDRDVTRQDLLKLGFVHQDDLYNRREHLLHLMLGDDYDSVFPRSIDDQDDRWTLLRYMIEYFGYYMDHDPDADDLVRFRAMIDSADQPAPSAET